MDSVLLCYLWEDKETATLSQHSLTDDTDEQKEQISFLHTETLGDLKVEESTDLYWTSGWVACAEFVF